MSELNAVILCNSGYEKKHLIKLSEQLEKIRTPCKVFLSSTDDAARVEKENIYYIREKISMDNILPLATSSLKLLTDKEVSTTDPANYKPIKITDLQKLQISPCDIYLRIHKQNLEKHLLRFKRNEGFDHSRVKTYIDNELRYMYVKDKDLDIFKNAISAEMIKQLNLSCDKTQTSPISTKLTFDYLITELKDEGFTPRNIEVVESVIESINQITESSKESSRLKQQLSLLFSSPDSDAYIHNHLTAVISAAIINKISWGSQQHIVKLSHASMFHDLEIIDRPELLELREESDYSSNNISEQDKKLVSRHALNSSLFMQDLPDLPLGVESIIIQHHGSPRGIGFVDKINPAKLSKLTLVFIIAESFVHTLLLSRKLKNLSYLHKKQHENQKISYIMSKIEKEYTSNQYREIITALKESF